MTQKPRLLIEDWLPAAAIGVECMRERSTGQQPPDKRLHVWFARRPLTVSRAAVLGSLLPADFPRDVFERLLGFGRPGTELVQLRKIMDSGIRLGGFGCARAFKGTLREDDLTYLHKTSTDLWGTDLTVIDPMAGGGSIPLEAARMGFKTIANEYNPVACVVLEAILDYPFGLREGLVEKALGWGKVLRERILKRVEEFFPKSVNGGLARPDGYVYARVVPCPDTQFPTPLVSDWHLLKPKSGAKIVAEPVVDKTKGKWSIRIREVGRGAGQLREPPRSTYGNGKGVSIFTGQQIPSEYIKAKAQAGEMKSVLYAIAVKTERGLRFEAPESVDLQAIAAAEHELARLRPAWERNNIIPTELYPEESSDPRPRLYGMPRWADMFAPRQLLTLGVLVEELRRLRPELVQAEGTQAGEAIAHLLALVVDKVASHNSLQSRWDPSNRKITNAFERHDFAFRITPVEMAACNAGIGLDWAITSVIAAYEELCKLSRSSHAQPVEINFGTAANLPQITDSSITAIVVDPPYADNVQYSELANFFYVWLKRTQGHRRPEWFSTYLCDASQEAVVNLSRHKTGDGQEKGDARRKANEFYQHLMTATFDECHRILRDDGVLTVMFTHKKQEAWQALFTSLIHSGFTITATWPVKTESEHSLHQAKKNAAQSTVVLVARKRPSGAGIGYFDSAMQKAIRDKARAAAERLKRDGLNAIDQLVGSFGPAIEVYSQYDDVRTDTGVPVGVDKAIDEASDAVSQWRIEQLAARGLEGVEPEGRFALLCWDVLGAAEFRFNEAKLLGHAVGMDVDQLVIAGLVSKTGDKVKMLSAKERRRERALEPDEVTETLFGSVTKPKRRTKKDALKVHPNDPHFRTALDACHALALRYAEAGGDAGGIGAAKALVRQQHWTSDSPVAELMSALVQAAPEAMRHEKDKTSAAAAFPEFRAWHALLKPLFDIEPPDWTEKPVLQGSLFVEGEADVEAEHVTEQELVLEEEEEANEENDE